ncbi:MAG: neutral ceramidase [Baekduia sp.]|nr:neutral ceramidase [Baekduia sp.]
MGALGRMARCGALAALAAMWTSAGPAVAAEPPPAALRAGAGQADITPPQTGYYLGGWTRADRLARGQSTRLFANALVLERDGRKIALVAAELFAIPGGLQEDVAREVADLGYDPASVVLAASHTHSGPGGFANNPTYNFAAPSLQTVTDPMTFLAFVQPKPADRQLYTFLVHQIALAVRRADTNLQPAALGWGHTDLTGLTQNRSIEAHLADHGIHVPVGKGTPQMDPDGVNHTIDPSVDVLRVDQLVPGPSGVRQVPIGAWSNFADHGTVVHAETQAYSGDHHASAWRRFAERVRQAAQLPAASPVVNVYPNSDEGDQTAGIVHVGIAAADAVGSAEADAMFRAWQDAGRSLSTTPALDLRWTRTCFCGRDTASGRVATSGKEGVPFVTGSEEGRGPLYDITHVSFEGLTSPIPDPEQGDKVVAPVGDPPPAVPFAVLRVADHALVAVPGEPTKQVGSRIKDAVLAAMAPAGVTRAVVIGLAYDYVQYITTPEEYGTQSYEGASSLYGPNEGTFVQEQLVDLARRLADGRPAPAPYPLDTSYGVHPDGPPYPAGADHGTITAEPASSYQRLGHATLRWQGGPSGHDRPVDAPFVLAERQVGGRWETADTDLGLDMLWHADDQGRYDATWEVPLDVPAGTYRLVVAATGYRLESQPFAVRPLTTLAAQQTPAGPGRVGVHLTYPPPNVDQDLTARPAAAAGGTVAFRVGDRTVIVSQDQGTDFTVAAQPGTTVTIPAGAAHDRAGNTTGAGASFTVG